MKPILFNTEMVRAILEGRKTVTRRPVKPRPERALIPIPDEKYWLGCFAGDDKCRAIKPPYQPGNIMYVRETWARSMAGTYLYRATDTPLILSGWHPSIHMPREAARIFLRVTDVRVERLQNITEAGAVKEGFEAILCNHPGGYPCTDCMNTGYLEPAMLGFVDTWNSTIKPSDRAIYGWDANPWVWVIQFERCERPKEVCPHGGAGEGGRLT